MRAPEIAESVRKEPRNSQRAEERTAQRSLTILASITSAVASTTRITSILTWERHVVCTVGSFFLCLNHIQAGGGLVIGGLMARSRNGHGIEFAGSVGSLSQID